MASCLETPNPVKARIFSSACCGEEDEGALLVEVEDTFEVAFPDEGVEAGFAPPEEVGALFVLDETGPPTSKDFVYIYQYES